jgi:hypothetical protein
MTMVSRATAGLLPHRHEEEPRRATDTAALAIEAATAPPTTPSVILPACRALPLDATAIAVSRTRSHLVFRPKSFTPGPLP